MERASFGPGEGDAEQMERQREVQWEQPGGRPGADKPSVCLPLAAVTVSRDLAVLPPSL